MLKGEGRHHGSEVVSVVIGVDSPDSVAGVVVTFRSHNWDCKEKHSLLPQTHMYKNLDAMVALLYVDVL